MIEDRRASFDLVIAEVHEPLQRYLRRRCPADDLDEVFNDALLTIWRRLEDIPPAKVLPWCYGVARRCLANHRRGTTRRLRLVHRVGAVAGGSSGGVWAPDRDAELHDALERLSELDREVVRLWAWENLEPREIAEVLETTPNAISVRLGRIRRNLESDLLRQNPRDDGHTPDTDHSELGS